MNNSHFSNPLLLIFLLAAAACCSSCASTGKKELQENPNIVYILVDDMGYGDLGTYGQEIIETPHLDKLAAEGIKFTQHYAGSTVCAPSRASLMTGRDTGHSRVRGNYETGKYSFGGELELREEDLTIGELLQDRAGYRTAVIGKWGMGMNGSSGEPKNKGFSYSYGFLNQAHAHWHYPTYLFRNGEKVKVAENQNGKREYFSNDIFTDDAVEFIKEPKKKPFFLYLALTTPHAEMLVPEDSIFENYKGKFEEVPFVRGKQGSDGIDSLGVYHSQAYPKAAYASMITRIDNDVNRIIQALKDGGLDTNTLVMFSSDNGSHSEGGANPEYFDSNGLLRGAKRDLYEGGIRVPFIAWWPGTIKPRQVSDHISSFWDVMITLAELVDLNIEDVETEGISFVPTLMGNTLKQEKHDYLYWEFHEGKHSHQAIREERWKAIRKNPLGNIELYDLKTDLSEESDVARNFPEIVEQMKRKMDTTRTENPYWPLK
ncbi:arylsulfatase [uncultured Salegentibacter sp.]|uniref:arylsulfatase n=1 Tax=uncultured Salegentibacter sp. TaxID=259320 RepID=UPI00259704B7|nr:arylsulfatase [uncultured Salegentibacter sp.]